MTSLVAGRGRDATWLVAIAAAMWGLDGWLRGPLARTLDAGTVVFWEHVVAVVVLLPWLPGAARAFVRAPGRDRLAIVAIGIGASAVATALFTRAFTLSVQHQDFTTPVVLQKLQPIVAIGLAVLVLRERLRPMYAVFLVPALVGAWLVAFRDPFAIEVSQAESALLAVGAAILWGAGTVLGRMLAERGALQTHDITTLRFAFGLVGAIGVVWLTDAPIDPGWGNLPRLAVLALVTGPLGLALYYRAMRTTPASRATLGELAFPATAAVVGAVIGTPLAWTQWVGLAVVVAVVVGLSWHESGRRPCVDEQQDVPALSS